jgi:hypothetical protein
MQKSLMEKAGRTIDRLETIVVQMDDDEAIRVREMLTEAVILEQERRRTAWVESMQHEPQHRASDDDWRIAMKRALDLLGEAIAAA